MYHFLQALPSFANEPPVSQEIPSSLTSIYQTQQFSSLAELGTTHRDTLMGGHSFYGHQFQPFTDILLCLPCFANIRLLNLHFSAQWSKHKTTNKKKTPALLRFLQNHAGTYSGVSTLWCKKRELLRVSRQHSAVRHRTAHKETC